MSVALLAFLACPGEPTCKESCDSGRDTGEGTADSSDSADTADSTPDTGPPPDADGDGSPDAEDCDDADPAVNPSADETCGDAIDQDCDGLLPTCGCDLDGPRGVAVADGRVSGTSEEFLGDGLAFLGDQDGDGLPELAVGAIGHDDHAGAVYVISGGARGALTVDDSMRITGTEGSWLGQTLAGAGDVDGDGLNDLLVGAPRDERGGVQAAGAAYLFLGPVVGGSSVEDAAATFWGGAWTDVAGTSLAGLGDIDGDGLPDLAVGEPGYDFGNEEWESDADYGRAFVLSGTAASGSLVDRATAILQGAEWMAQAGSALARAGDIDGDGIDDLLVAAERGDYYSGVVYLVMMPVTGTVWLEDADARFQSTDDLSGLGHALAGAEDVDADGRPDLLLSDPSDDDGGVTSGAVHLFTGLGPGTFDQTNATATVTGGAEGDKLGYQVSFPGDLDCDGVPDVAATAAAESTGAPEGGALYLVPGSALSGTVNVATVAASFHGDTERGYFYALAAGSADVDGNGVADLLAGAGGAADRHGETYLFLTDGP